MAFCGKCGSEVSAGAAFCPKCGAPQSGDAVVQTTPSVQSGMSENVAALLSYLLGWITGIIFFLIDKRPFVRFHAAQSIVVFGALQVVSMSMGMMFGAHLILGAGFSFYSLVDLAAFALWIVLLIKAF